MERGDVSKSAERMMIHGIELLTETDICYQSSGADQRKLARRRVNTFPCDRTGRCEIDSREARKIGWNGFT